ncbi:cyclic nucleotide-binding domain-containing protein [Spirulina sp. CS-785/01]|uniref:cyclic nucleotide-binding domain-containing protein n=1 Tax=Spirulina sp. CS-785/01 TaxID=3021716 RepID=UPI00232D69D0|nr:cyclic nucleotide-binding domain-containing protein [Spirulina sp. CS-785/01]MDB9312797.1 cyclic nucleotide-binding domain-containing protein [Spirulina sp. CS-785/01]
MPGLTLRQKIPLLIVSPILAAVALITGFGYIYGQRAVDQLAQETTRKSTNAISSHLQSYLDRPHQVLAINQAAIVSGQLDPTDNEALRKFAFEIVSRGPRDYFYSTPSGRFLGIEPYQEGELMYWLRDETTAPNAEIYRLDEQGNPTEIEEITLFDPRQRDWYKAAVAAGEPTWSNIYLYANRAVLGMGAVFPYYENEELQGVFLVDITLSDISDFLQELSISPNGEAFIIEPDGKLVGNSLEVANFLEQGDSAVRLNGQESNNPFIRELTQVILDEYAPQGQKLEALQQFNYTVENTSQYVGLMPFTDNRGLEWYVVVIIPKTDFQYVINASTRSALLVGIMVALLSIILGLLVARSIVKPIEALNYAAQSVEDNQFEPDVLNPVSQRKDELGQLATVFQRMGAVIMSSQASLKEQMSTLEIEVAKAKQNSRHAGDYNEFHIHELLKRSRQVRRKMGHEQNLSHLLRQVVYFSEFQDKDIEKLIALGKKEEVPENTYLCREDEPGDAFYIILEGAVEIYVEKINKFLTQLSSGSFFGELSLLLGIPRTATVRTKEETVLFTLDQKSLQKLLKQYPNMAENIAQQLTQHQEELASRKETFKKMGIMDDEDAFNNNPLQWIRGRLKTLFALS